MSFQIKTEKILSPSNIKKIIMLGISLKNGIESIEQDLIKEYDTTKTYSPDMACYYNDYLYRCLFTTTGEFDINSWKRVGDSLEFVNKAQVEAMLGLTQDQLDALASIILDSQVRLDKTWSSSKIYESVQAAIRENKTFTLQEFAKANKASYNVVSATSEMTDKSVIYLMSNNTNYDMYIVESDGTPTKIGDTKIDLSQYAKLSDLNNYYDKTTSDGKYATITTVDGKVDKTSILSTISSTPSDDNLLSEKAINNTFVKKTDIVDNLTSTDTDKPLSANQGKVLKDEIYSKANEDDVIKKTDITTTINSTSTDTQVPSAKVVKTELDKKVYKNTFIDLNKLPNGSYCKISSFSKGDNEFIALDIVKYDGTVNRIELTNEGNVINHINYNGTRWIRVGRFCTTNVLNVKTKNIKPTFPSTVTLGTTQIISYSVKNGWANVSIVMQLKASPKLGWTSITTELPKPDKEIHSVSYGETGINNNRVAFRLKVTGALEMLISSEITQSDWWNVNFSYPVAE